LETFKTRNADSLSKKQKEFGEMSIKFLEKRSCPEKGVEKKFKRN